MNQLFDYSSESEIIHKAIAFKQYQEEDWEDLIYHDLEQGYPVLYCGDDKDGLGHAFICDGYDNGFFHINWGWNGSCDGYFKLSVASPSSKNYDETERNDGYSQDQCVIINLIPNNPDRLASVASLPTSQVNSNQSIYTVSGLPLDTPFSESQLKDKLSKGIYIVKGKKVIHK